MSLRTDARNALINLLTADATFTAAGLVPRKGSRKSAEAKAGKVAVQVRVGGADYGIDTKGGPGASRIRHEFDLEVLIEHADVLVTEGEAPVDGALEDAVDALVDVVRLVVENNQTLTDTVHMARVTDHEPSMNQENDTDFCTATVTVRCMAFSTMGA